MIAAIPYFISHIQLGFTDALLVLGFFLALNLIIGNLVRTTDYGEWAWPIDLSGVFIPHFSGDGFWAQSGMLLSVPLTMIVKIGLETQQDSAWFAYLLTSKALQTIDNKKQKLRGEGVCKN